ncbi:MAG: hypothetical protein AB7F23_06825 [Phycisphaerae bacterium]
MDLKRITFVALALLAGVTTAFAADVAVSSNITTDTVWTSDNVYNLTQQIYVEPGASLTIEAGTLIQSGSEVEEGGSLAVCRGAKIYVNGTKDAPVIMTSYADDLQSWHEGCNEWGNLTIMGNALISASHYGGVQVGDNTKEPTGLNEKQMEGLTAEYAGDQKVMYGGADDNDDSGSISFLSIRYGGKVIGLANELNGLSLGAIGRETDINHIEIMNNVDDGIEIWGGTVCMKYVNIWNVGDDSFDIDEGWRGKAQFGLIVQGHSKDASQGSGVGDNCFETDGAEDSDAQPVTTGAICNFTVVGQPVDGDGATVWRDNARMQYRNCVFMDCGEKVVRPDGDDGDGANGYGYNGTLSWEDTWTTSASVTSAVNIGTADPSVLYTAQDTAGYLAEIRNCVFYNNKDYAEAGLRGVFNPEMTNVMAVSSPITTITRGANVTRGGKTMQPVTFIDPRPRAVAATATPARTGDSFFAAASYIGGFSADENWLEGWTAASAYGMTTTTEVLITDNIDVDTVWTADHIYNLQNQVYILPGASLTIDAGTLVQSTAGLGGSLAVCRGAKIYVNGTEDAPVIMTSTEDTLTEWHEGCNEWGNLTIMGNALISASHYGGVQVGDNTKEPTGLNEKQMEGLTAEYAGDQKVMYGGADDNDDSGSISFLSIRYGGKVIGLANELNGLSLGAIGRETDINHIEIMNNVDDGIEIWGGTVCMKYVNIWNVGDDSFDIDEGWRGKAQFGLIVQGHSKDASQGSGVGDNCFETDGAEDSDAQPVTTGAICNFTVVGQPVDGDGATVWRDNARMQYRNCVFMDCGEKVVRPDGDDGDGANGYGYNGTLSWEDTWTTSASVTSAVNIGTADPSVLYTAQDTAGYLAEIRNCVFYNNKDYADAQALGVLNSAMNNVVSIASPIKAITRGANVTRGGKTMQPVTFIDPRAAIVAAQSATPARKGDSFFAAASYIGGFSATNNWLDNWSAVSAYGMTGDSEASLATADLTGDGFVDNNDLAVMAGSWLQDVE